MTAPSPDLTCLTPLDEDTLACLASSAVLDADPEDVMPFVSGPPGWTPDRIAAFLAFHRSRRGGLRGPHAEEGWAVVAGGSPSGIVRLRVVSPGRFEVGLWLARSVRGVGVGAAALHAAAGRAIALGAGRLVAETTCDNIAALAALRRLGARLEEPASDKRVRAELAL